MMEIEGEMEYREVHETTETIIFEFQEILKKKDARKELRKYFVEEVFHHLVKLLQQNYVLQYW